MVPANIRALNENDAAAFWHLRLEALETEPFAFGTDAEEHRTLSVATVALRFRDMPSSEGFTLGAFAGDTLVGMITFVRETRLKDGHKGRVHGFYVTPQQRGSGIGRQLMAALMTRAKADPSLEQITLVVSTCQEAACQLYRDLGFITYGTEPNALKIRDRYIDADYMILKLRAG